MPKGRKTCNITTYLETGQMNSKKEEEEEVGCNMQQTGQMNQMSNRMILKIRMATGMSHKH